LRATGTVADSSYECERTRLLERQVSRFCTSKIAADTEENINGEIDENFWAQAAADRADMDDPADDMGELLQPTFVFNS